MGRTPMGRESSGSGGSASFQAMNLLAGKAARGDAGAARTLERILAQMKTSNPTQWNALWTQLKRQGLDVRNDRIVNARTGQPVAATSFTPSSSTSGAGWSEAARNLGASSTASPAIAPSAGTQTATGANTSPAPGLGMGFDPNAPQGDILDPDKLQGEDYSGTFFGDIDPLALTELRNEPRDLWNQYMSRGNSGKGFFGTGMQEFGANDFTALSALAPVLAEGGYTTPGQEMKWLEGAMSGQMGSGGGLDPGKLISSAMSAASRASTAEEQEVILSTLMNNLEPFMGSTANQLMQARLAPMMADFRADTMENTGRNRQDVLLRTIQRALGM